MSNETTTAAQMTQAEVDAEFAEVELRFHSYYKYSFTFVGTSDDGKTIEVEFGGDKDDIYDYEIKAADGVPFVGCEAGKWKYVVVFSGNRKVFEARRRMGFMVPA